MGYIVLPPHLLKVYKELGMFKQTVSTMQQLTFATFIQNGIGNVILTEVVRYIKENIFL